MGEKSRLKGRGRSGRAVPRRDPAKEARLAALVGELVARGQTVRREELKRGLGWRALSGACRVFGRDTIFVDRRLAVDEQIAFLEARLALLKSTVAADGEVPGREQVDTVPAGEEVMST